jgi:hypothetical protein
VVISPSCEVHGPRSRFVPRAPMSQTHSRVMGAIHSRTREG